MSEKKAIEALIIDSVKSLAEDFQIDSLINPDAATLLYGIDGPLDSMALVNLVADIEDAISEKFSVFISLADEKAMSARHSPYRSVTSLADAVLERMPS